MAAVAEERFGLGLQIAASNWVVREALSEVDLRWGLRLLPSTEGADPERLSDPRP